MYHTTARKTAFTAALTLIAAVGGIPAQTNGTAAGFEIDDLGALLAGDGVQSGVASGTDWADGDGALGVLDADGNPATGEIALRWVDLNWGPAGDGVDFTVFGGGGNKTNDAIGEGQDPWRWRAGDGGPKKNDITNVYVHTREASGERWLFLGAETRATNGNSAIDFEFSQLGIVQTGTVSGELIGQGPDNGRTIGDLLVSVQFVQGGVLPVASVRAWNGEEFQSAATPEDVLVGVNLTDIPHPTSGEWVHFTADGATTEVLSALQLVEVGLNLTTLGFDFDVCETESTVMVRTRASQQIESAMKDFALLTFPLHPLPEVEIIGPATVESGDEVTYTASIVEEEPASAESIADFLLGNGPRQRQFDLNRDGAISASDVVRSLSEDVEPFPTNGSALATPELAHDWTITGAATFCTGLTTAQGASVCVAADGASGETFTLTLITSSGFCSRETSLTATVVSPETP